jgi:hypothetical protein
MPVNMVLVDTGYLIILKCLFSLSFNDDSDLT